MRRDAETPKDYLAQLEGEQLTLVKTIRKAIRRAMPRFDEGVRYGMLDYPGLGNLGAQKRYVALYVAPAVLKKHKRHFPGVDAGKSCLRFTKPEQADPTALDALLEAVWAYRRENDDQALLVRTS